MTTYEEAFLALTTHPSDDLRQLIAELSTSATVLESLATDAHPHVRREIAINPHTPAHVLESLASDSEWFVRNSVALNPNTPSVLLASLVGMHDRAVAANPAASAHTLGVLAEHGNLSVWAYLAENSSSPPEVLELIAYADSDSDSDSSGLRRRDIYNSTLAKVAAHASASVGLLYVLSGDVDYRVRASAASNPRTSIDDVRALVADGTSTVRQAVALHPAITLSDVLPRLHLKAGAEYVERLPEIVARTPDEELAALSDLSPADGATLPREWLLELVKATRNIPLP